MAFWKYSITAVGSAGVKSTLNFMLREALYADAVVSGGNCLTAFQAVSDATVIRTTLALVDEIGGALPANVDLAIQGTLTGKVAGTQKGITLRWPAPKDALRLGPDGEEYNELDLSNAAVMAYWDLFEATGEAYISDGEDASALGPRSSQIISRASSNP